MGGWVVLALVILVVCYIVSDLKMVRRLIVVTALMISGNPALTEKLPNIFVGRWMYYQDAKPGQTCNGSEVMTVTSKDVTWNTEGGCFIQGVGVNRKFPDEHHIAIDLLCLEEEGRRTPLKVRKPELWSMTVINGASFLMTSDPKDIRITVYKKCS
jgi:hypothetical protein